MDRPNFCFLKIRFFEKVTEYFCRDIAVILLQIREISEIHHFARNLSQPPEQNAR